MLPLHRRVLLVSSLARIQPEGIAIALVLWCSARDVSRLAGFLLAAATFPQLATGPLMGRALDRAARPARTAALAAGVSAAACAGLVVADLRPVPSILAAIALSLSTPVLTGGLSSLIMGWSEDHAGLAAWDSTGYNAAGLVAPVIVTVAAVWRPSLAIAALGVASLAVAAALTAVGDQPHANLDAADPDPPRVRDALAAIVRSRSLRAVTISTTMLSAGLGGLELALASAVMARGLAIERAGVLATVIAVGALAGSITLTRRVIPLEAATMTLCAVGATGVIVIALAVSPWWAMVAVAAMLGLLDAPLLVGTYRARTEASPPNVRAGVFTLAASAKLGAGSIGAVGVATIVAHGSADLGLVLIGATGIVGAAIGAVQHASDNAGPQHPDGVRHSPDRQQES